MTDDGYVFDPEDFPDICDVCGHEVQDCTCPKEKEAPAL